VAGVAGVAGVADAACDASAEGEAVPEALAVADGDAVEATST
jgi:hypothetical protein